MVWKELLQTGKILLGEEGDKAEVLWLDRHSSGLLGVGVNPCVCARSFLHLCCSVQRIITYW